MLETASSQENLSRAESPSPAIFKIKRKNKIHSPPPLSPSLSNASSNDVSDLFRAKKKSQLPPVPLPRTNKITVKKEDQTAETTFIETHNVLSPKSDTISYKEQLRNRFLSVKKQAGSSVTPVSRASRKGRYSIDDTALGEENETIESELKKRELKVPKDRDDYDFFCTVHNLEDNIQVIGTTYFLSMLMK